MKKFIIILVATLLPACAGAQFLKKLGKALEKVNNTLNGVSESSGQNSGKVGYITYQEEPSFVNNWGRMDLIGAVGNSETGAVQVAIRIQTKDGKNYAAKADKVEGPDGGQLVENRHWTRGEWTLTDASKGVYVSPVWVVPTSYQSLGHVCVVTYLNDIYADIYNIPIDWRKPQNSGSSSVTISQKSIGGISIGMQMKSVPGSVTGLYGRRMASGYGCDGTQYECYDGEDRVLAVIDEDDNGIVDDILVFKNGIKIEGTPVYIGMPLSNLKTVSGVKAVNGGEYYKYGNCNISYDQDNKVCMIEIK